MITPYEWLLKTKFTIRQEINWNNGTYNFDEIRFYPRCERIYCLAKGKAWMYNRLKLTDDWHIEPVETDVEHTRAFPDKLVKNIMATVNFETVLDPFMGSGTVGRIADEHGKKWIGFELKKEYAESGERKLSEQRAQGVLI